MIKILLKATQLGLFGGDKPASNAPKITVVRRDKKTGKETPIAPSPRPHQAPQAPQGYQPVPGSKHGGFRKQVGGKWQYWYPGAGEIKHATQAPTSNEIGRIKTAERVEHHESEAARIRSEGGSETAARAHVNAARAHREATTEEQRGRAKQLGDMADRAEVAIKTAEMNRKIKEAAATKKQEAQKPAVPHPSSPEEIDPDTRYMLYSLHPSKDKWMAERAFYGNYFRPGSEGTKFFGRDDYIVVRADAPTPEVKAKVQTPPKVVVTLAAVKQVSATASSPAPAKSKPSPQPKKKAKFKLAEPAQHNQGGYSGNAWHGGKYEQTSKLGSNEITSMIRKDIKQAQEAGFLPAGLKIGVSQEHYSGGWSMNLRINELPHGMELYSLADYDPFEHRREREIKTPQGTKVAVMRPEIEQALKRLGQIAEQYNYHDNDSMTDYFSNRFHVNVSVNHSLESVHRERAIDPGKGLVLTQASQAFKTRSLEDVKDALVGYYGSGLHGSQNSPWGLERDLHRVLSDNMEELAGKYHGKLAATDIKARYRSKGKPPARVEQRYLFSDGESARRFEMEVKGLAGIEQGKAQAQGEIHVNRITPTLISVTNLPLDVPSRRKKKKAGK